MEETESESHVGTKKVESASWVHFDNLKGELLKSLKFSLGSLDSLLILIEINITYFRSSQYCFLLDGRSHHQVYLGLRTKIFNITNHWFTYESYYR